MSAFVLGKPATPDPQRVSPTGRNWTVAERLAPPLMFLEVSQRRGWVEPFQWGAATKERCRGQVGTGQTRRRSTALRAPSSGSQSHNRDGSATTSRGPQNIPFQRACVDEKGAGDGAVYPFVDSGEGFAWCIPSEKFSAYRISPNKALSPHVPFCGKAGGLARLWRLEGVVRCLVIEFAPFQRERSGGQGVDCCHV